MQFLIPLEAVVLGYVALNLKQIQYSIPAFATCVLLFVSINFCSVVLHPQDMLVSGDSPENTVNGEILGKKEVNRYREILFQQCKGYKAAIEYYVEFNDIAAASLSDALSWAKASFVISAVIYIIMALPF